MTHTEAEPSDEDVQKIAINNQYGGFGISDEAIEWLVENRGWSITDYGDDGGYVDEDAEVVDTGREITGGRYRLIDKRNDEMRTHPDLIEVIEERPVTVDTGTASPKVVEVPAGVEWEIEEYDGNEWVAEKHRTWS